METLLTDFLNTVNDPLGGVMVFLLAVTGLWFTIRTRGVQFRLIGEMFRLLFRPEGNTHDGKHVSSFQAFTISLASRVGTGNLAGVATAIVSASDSSRMNIW